MISYRITADFQTIHGALGTVSLVWSHTTNDTPQDTAWCTVMPWASSWVGVSTLADECGILELVAEE